MKILFPTAFSMHAGQYFQYASELAHFFNGEIIMMHTFTKSESRTISSDSLLQRGRLMMKELKEFADKNLPNQYNAKISYHIKAGGPIASILSTIKQRDIDLVIMGMKAKTEDSHAHIGGVTREIMQVAECPVLVIPPSSNFTAINKIACVLDHKSNNQQVANEMLNWCKVLDAKLYFLHLLNKNEKQEEIEQQMATLSKQNQGKALEITVESIKGDPKIVIPNYTVKNKVDILVLTSPVRTFFERLFLSNTMMRIAQRVDTPVLVLKH